MENCLTKILEDVESATLNVDLTKKENPSHCLEVFKKDANKIGYNIVDLREDDDEKGLYHVYLRRKEDK